MRKLWSVIVPNFNNALYLDDLMSPFLKLNEEEQKLVEVIISDDKSTDNSLEVINKYIEINPNMYKCYKAEVNSHHGGAINNGMSIATGEWFTLLDGDDYYDVLGMKKLISVLKDSPEHIDCYSVDVKSFFDEVRNPYFEDFDRHMHNISTLYVNTLPIHCHVARTRICKDMRIPTGVAYDDYYSTSYIYDKIKNIQIRKDIMLFHYRQNRPGQSVSTLFTNPISIIQSGSYNFMRFKNEVNSEYKFLIPNVLYVVRSFRLLGANNDTFREPKHLFRIMNANIPNKYNIDYMDFCNWFSDKYNSWLNPVLEKSKDLENLGEEYIEF